MGESGAGRERIALDNGTLRVEIDALGAELACLRQLGAGLDYLWEGDAMHWNRRAPVLFPIVGRLREGRASWRGRPIRLGQHGFARDRRFEVTSQDTTAASLVLREDTATLAAYPFAFALTVSYRLEGAALAVTYRVDNPGSEELPFSIGAHPGFRCPLLAGERMEDYHIELELAERADRHLVEDGLIADRTEPVLAGERFLPLAPATFARGALVFTDLRSRLVRLRSRHRGHGVELSFPGFPTFAVWSKPGAPFVCLEPWCGIADPANASGRFEDKPGLLVLAPGASFTRTHTIRPL